MTSQTPTPAPTQVRYPWRATVRTVFAGLVGLASLAPVIAATAHVDTLPAVVQVVAVSGAVTRVLAIPGVNAWLTRFVPWLGTGESAPQP